MNNIHMDLELKHLQLVQAIAEHRTLTKAGLQLHLTQSALSHQLKDLESRYGRELFTRTPGGMVPTPAGQALIDTARAVLPQVTAAEAGLRDGSVTRVPLRITTECYTCYHWLPPVIQGLKAAAPAVDVSINVAATASPLDALVHDEIDLAIMATVPRQRGITQLPLFEDELMLIVSPQHRLARHGRVSVKELRTETLLIYGNSRQSHLLSRVLAPAGVTPAEVKEMHLTEAIVEMVKAGLGVAILARWAVQPHLQTGGLIALHLGREGHHRTWFAVMRNRLVDAEHVRAFVRLAGKMSPGRTRRTA
jgi:LysR family transcriptional regulator for metE and metH